MATIRETEKDIRLLVENWAAAVRRGDIDDVLAHHSGDMVMYDVPPPFESRGIDAYMKTWGLFFNCPQNSASVFDIIELNVKSRVLKFTSLCL